MKTSVCFPVLVLLLLIPAMARALAEERFGNAAAVRQPEWAEGVLEVVNLESRVYSIWVNGNEQFYYRGGPQALNEALRRFAAIRDAERRVVLLPGAGKAQSLQGQVVPFQWQLSVPSGIYRAMTRQRHAVLTVYVNFPKSPPVEPEKVTAWIRDLDAETFATREEAETQLRKAGRAAKSLLRAALTMGPGPEARRRIVGLLERLEGIDVTDLEIPKGVTAVTATDLVAEGIQRLADPNETIRAMAAMELVRLATHDTRVVPALATLLEKDPKEYVRRTVAGSLAHLGAGARAAEPTLRKLRNDADTSVRDACVKALKAIEEHRPEPGRAERLEQERAILKDTLELRSSGGKRGD